MRFSFKPLTHEGAREISGWSYEEPYSIYNGNPESVPALLDPQNRYHAAFDESGTLAGYFCFGADARIPAGERIEIYKGENVLDVGLGLNPQLTGKGIGAEFVRAGLRFAGEAFHPSAFRLTVATFNQRAIRVYKKVGFRPLTTFKTRAPDGEREWLVMMMAEAGSG